MSLNLHEAGLWGLYFQQLPHNLWCYSLTTQGPCAQRTELQRERAGKEPRRGWVPYNLAEPTTHGWNWSPDEQLTMFGVGSRSPCLGTGVAPPQHSYPQFFLLYASCNS